MASPKYAWGIDIGNRALKAVKLVRTAEGLRVDDLDVIEHETILSNAGDNRDSLIETSLAHFAQRHPVKGGGVVAISVGGQASFARFIKLPPVEDRKIPEIVKFEAIQQIPFPLDEVEWDYSLFRQADSPDVEVGIFAMRKELVNQHIKRFSSLGMNVQAVQTSPLAVYNALYRDDRLKKGTTMVVDMGAENTDLIIADGETVWLRNIPVGGNNFTETLAKQFKVQFAKAEELKRTAATSKYARQIFQAMRPVFADLVSEIQRSIGFYSSVHRDSRISRIIALGGTFRLPTLQKYVGQNLQLKIETLDGLGAGAPEDGRLAALLNENLISMVGAYGLAVQAMGDAKITSSLLPQEIRTAKVWKEKIKWFAASAALFAVGAGLAFYSWHNVSVALAEQGPSAEGPPAAGTIADDDFKVLEQAKRLDGTWEGIERSGSADRQRILNVNSMSKDHDLWPALVADISNKLPKVDFSKKEALLAAGRESREQIVIESIVSRYEPDLGQFVNTDANGRFTLPDPAFAGPQQEPPAPIAAPDVTNANGPDPRTGGTAGYTPGGYNPLAPRFPNRPIPGMSGGLTPPGAVPLDPNAPPDKKDTRHGYILTLYCTSPNKAAHAFIESKFLKPLTDALTFGSCFVQKQDGGYETKRPYYVARTLISRERAVLQNTEKQGRLAAAVAAALAAEQAKAAAEANPNAAQNPGGGTGTAPPPPPPGGTAGRGGFIPGRGFVPGAGGGGFQSLPGNIDPANLKPDQLPKDFHSPLSDPVTLEDASKDYEFTLVIAVPVDPDPPAPTAGNDPNGKGPARTVPRSPSGQ